MANRGLFSFLERISPDLYTLANQIEEQLYDQPDTTLMKARLFCEQLLKLVFQKENIQEIYPYKHVERIQKLYREQLIEKDLYMKLEWLRKKGNQAAHEIHTTKIEDVLQAHRFLYDLAVWYMQVYVQYDFEPPTYDLPRPTAKMKEKETMEAFIEPYMNKTLEKIDHMWKEIHRELETINKERKRLSERTEEVKEDPKKPFPLLNYLRQKNLTYIDNRPKNGALWVLGDWSIRELLLPLKEYKIYFRYTNKGGRATKGKPAWFLLNKELPLVPTETIKREAENETVKPIENQQKTEIEKSLSVVPMPENFWIVKGQIAYPKELLSTNLPNETFEGLKALKREFSINKYEEITEDLLRKFYQSDRTNFYRALDEMYVLGFRFLNNLAKLHQTDFKETEHYLRISSSCTKKLQEIFSSSALERLRLYGISTTTDLHRLLISSIAWMIREQEEKVENLLAKANNDDKKEDSLLESEKDIQDKEVSETKSEEKSEEGKDLYYKTEKIVIPKAIAEQPLKILHIEGCNHLLNELEKAGIETSRQLPEKLDSIHERFHGVGPRAVEKFWEQMQEISKSMPKEVDLVEEGSLYFEGKQLKIPENLRQIKLEPNQFRGSVQAIKTLKEEGIHTIGQLPANLKEIGTYRGIGQKRIATIFNQLEMIVEQEIENERLKRMPKEERYRYELSNFEKWYETIRTSPEVLKQDKISKRYIDFIRRRYRAALQGLHLTLEQIGDQEGVTRERIRQILKRGDGQVLKKWQFIDHYLQEKLEKQKIIKTSFPIKSREAVYLLLHALESAEIYQHDLQDMTILTILPEQEFSNYLKAVKEEVEQLFQAKKISKTALIDYCHEKAEKDQISEEILLEIASSTVRWVSEDQGLLKNTTKADLAEMVLLNYPEGIEAYKQEEELIEKANEILPGSFKGERSFVSVLTRDNVHDRIALWGRGVYIHQNYITKDETWVHEVQDLAYEWLEEEEFIHVAKLYRAVKDEAKDRNVPNEYALYFLMRYYDKGILSFPRFPNLLPRGADLLENEQWVVNFMRQKNRPVSISELRQEFVKDKGWREFTLQHNLMNSEKIISYDHGYYTLIENYATVTKEKLEPIYEKIQLELQEGSIVYIRTFFEDNDMYLKSIGIPTDHVLYVLLKRMDFSSMRFPKFPFIVSDSFEGDSLAAQRLVEDYIREEGRIVAREEVLHWLDETLGADSRVLDLALLKMPNVYYYSVGQFGEYVHRDTLALTEKREREILKQINTRYKKIKKTKERPYVLLPELYVEEELPTLPNHIPWSMRLLGDVLKKSGQWIPIGSYDEIFTPKTGEITSEIAFIKYLLENHFNGAVKIKELKTYLVNIRYSSDGELLKPVREVLEKEEAPFQLLGDELIDKKLLEK